MRLPALRQLALPSNLACRQVVEADRILYLHCKSATVRVRSSFIRLVQTATHLHTCEGNALLLLPPTRGADLDTNLQFQAAHCSAKHHSREGSSQKL